MKTNDSQKLYELLQKAEIESVLIQYALACDQRDWLSFNSVFAENVCVDYGGEYILTGRDAVVAMIKSLLGGCGPTQHLIGNFRINFSGDATKADCACYVRAAHSGQGSSAGLFYEVWAEYHDQLELTNSQWLITRRTMKIIKEVGQRAVLSAAH